MKIQEIHLVIKKITNIIEIKMRITKFKKVLKIRNENYENLENPYYNQENPEKILHTCEKYESHKNNLNL